MIVNLTAAYDTVWDRGLACNLLRLLPDRHMVHMFMEMVDNRSFMLTTGNTMPQEQRPIRICPVAPSIQHLHL